MSDAAEIGVTGLAVMGSNLARNIARRGIPVAVHNRTPVKTEQLLDEHGDEGPFIGAKDFGELVSSLARPRRILLMVKAGKPVDAVIDDLIGLLEPGDVIIDGGNSLFTDTTRRARALEQRGLHYLGCGISGGEEGALHGPSIMPGGTREGYEAVGWILERVAARVGGTPCCAYMGPEGAGHYVKMAHNGIEYADMQLIAEAYDLLRDVGGMTAHELADVFRTWNQGDLDSFLIEITAEVLAHVDEATGDPLVDVILDAAEQKGTGRWTAQDGLELGVPITAITEAVFARSLSAQKEQRTGAAKVLPGPSRAATDADGLVDDVRDALYASKVVAYAQGFEQMAAASQTHDWDLDLETVAAIWRGGCIIRARFLERIREAYRRDGSLSNLLLDDYFTEAVARGQDAWRRVVRTATDTGVPVPAFTSSLSYYDGYRRSRGPANLIQALRDRFGAHTYERVDRSGRFHTRWSEDRREVPADS
jgi:6-phosphogluconate dehydrogenase